MNNTIKSVLLFFSLILMICTKVHAKTIKDAENTEIRFYVDKIVDTCSMYNFYKLFDNEEFEEWLNSVNPQIDELDLNSQGLYLKAKATVYIFDRISWKYRNGNTPESDNKIRELKNKFHDLLEQRMSAADVYIGADFYEPTFVILQLYYQGIIDDLMEALLDAQLNIQDHLDSDIEYYNPNFVEELLRSYGSSEVPYEKNGNYTAIGLFLILKDMLENIDITNKMVFNGLDESILYYYLPRYLTADYIYGLLDENSFEAQTLIEKLEKIKKDSINNINEFYIFLGYKRLCKVYDKFTYHKGYDSNTLKNKIISLIESLY